MKKKLKDITLREWIYFKENNMNYKQEQEAVTAIKEGNLDYEIEIYLLDIKEANYLKKVIQPFRDRIEGIYLQDDAAIKDYVNLCFIFKYGVNSAMDERILLPSFKKCILSVFKKGTMYTNLELDKTYTLNELHL